MKSLERRGSDKERLRKPGSFSNTYLISQREIFFGTDLINSVMEFGSKPKYGFSIESLGRYTSV
jgi:hypothetical protein